MAFNRRCYDLAAHFLPREPDAKVAALAQAIQDVINGWLEYEADARRGLVPGTVAKGGETKARGGSECDGRR
jgi:hypothetical protein